MSKLEYKIIVAKSTDDLVKDVTKSIEDGWEPFGAFTYVYHHTVSDEFAQTMVKKTTTWTNRGLGPGG